MECTQRLECTQDLYDTRTERVCPEQIGFLGICGVKHPLLKGPNKIGRDPQTCSIVLNLTSVSRQHAVINILNKKDFMLMDLDSANKTKLMDKIIPPYIPHPLKNGDLVQFGDIFGVFRLLEEENDLPMTQAIDIPETPVSTRHVSKLNKMPNTTVPESPDVSDRDDSFIAPSQPKGEKCFNTSKSHFIKPSSNIIAIKPVGSNKIDNIYWSSSKRSVSLNSDLNESHGDFNKSDNNGSIHEMETQNPFSRETSLDEKHDDIHNMETQAPYLVGKSVKKENNISNIYDMETQVPYLKKKTTEQNKSNIHEMDTKTPFLNDKSLDHKNNIHEMETQAITAVEANDSIDSIYNANTQVPSPSIHSLATQLPTLSTEHLPEVCKIDNQQEMQINLFATSKVNDDDIFSADTQPFVEHRDNVEKQPDISLNLKDSKALESDAADVNKSDDEIILPEMDTDGFDNLDSQPLVPSNYLPDNDEFDNKLISDNITSEKKCEQESIKAVKSNVEIHSDSSTDCEDILLPSQKDKEDDDVTDCEDDILEEPIKVPVLKCNIASAPNVDFEDMLTQRIDNNIEDLATQVITLDNEEGINCNSNFNKDVCFEDLPTQVLEEERESIKKVPSATDHAKTSHMDSPFKIPSISPKKLKRRDIKLNVAKEKPASSRVISGSPIDVDDDKYYAATQDILEDLCSQQVAKPNVPRHDNESDDDLVPCSVEDYKTGERFPHLENLSPIKTLQTLKSSDSADDDGKVVEFVSKLSSQQIREVIGLDSQVDKLRKEPSYPSDVEVTPKKVKPIKFMDIDLPNSQEIKTIVSLHSKTPVTESSSESETEIDSQDQCTPILFRKKSKPKNDAKIDLTKKFDVSALPTRVITRVRKPALKLQNDDVKSKEITKSILKPKYMTEQEEDIDKDIINENISRLKSKSEKSKQKVNRNKKVNSSKEENKKGEKENEKRTYHASKKSDKLKSDKTKHSTGKDIKGSVKDENNPDKKTNDEIINIDEKTDTTKKRGSKRKSDEEVSISKVNLSTKGLEDSSSQNTSAETNTSIKSTRSTRGRRMVDAVKVDSQDEENSQKTRKRGRPKKQLSQPIEIDLTEEVTDIRRSKRQRTSKEKTEEEVQKITSILKKDKSVNLEQSAVYSLSSESGTDSPVNLKRHATSELAPPSHKRTRSNTTTTTALNNTSLKTTNTTVLYNTSLRATPARMNRTQHVLFTAFPSEEVKGKLEKLGAVIVSDVTACTMVLTLQIKRTFKLLCAVGLGRPIVGPSWVQACVDSNMIVDPWLYVLKDEAAEKRFQFNLERVLHSKRNFLKGYNLSSTPNVLPNTTEMKLIVECSGGVWKEGGSNWICVSCGADKALWPLLKKKGATVVATEFILGGVLRQRVDIEATKL